jgi:hypothetical protein
MKIIRNNIIPFSVYKAGSTLSKYPTMDVLRAMKIK